MSQSIQTYMLSDRETLELADGETEITLDNGTTLRLMKRSAE